MQKIKQIDHGFSCWYGRWQLRFIFVVTVVTLVAPNSVLPLYAWPLLRNDHPSKDAAAVIVLMGGAEARPRAAAKAVMDGYAERFLMVESQPFTLETLGYAPRESDLTRSITNQVGVPNDKIILIDDHGRATSTRDEALAYASYFAKNPPSPRRVVVVTSWPHSSRAGWIMEKALDPLGIEVQMMPVEKAPFEISTWWKSEFGMIFVFEEYVKWGRYLALYAFRSP